MEKVFSTRLCVIGPTQLQVQLRVPAQLLTELVLNGMIDKERETAASYISGGSARSYR